MSSWLKEYKSFAKLRRTAEWIGADVFNCSQNRLLDAKSRPPPQSANPGAIEEDKRTIADPAAFASRIRELRIQPEMPANPTDGVIDFAILVRPKIEYVHFVVGAIEGRKNRVDAILNV